MRTLKNYKQTTAEELWTCTRILPKSLLKYRPLFLYTDPETDDRKQNKNKNKTNG